MIAQHVLFPGIPKSLDFLSSMYCHFHRYWKDEINDYTRLPENMEQYWTYNCKDVCVTYEIALVLENLLDHVGRRQQYDFMQATARSALRTMLLGMRIDQKSRSEIAGQLMSAIMEYETLIQDIVGFPLNVGSPKQMQEFFYGDLKLPVQIDRKTKRPTLNAKAMAALAEKEPLLRPLVELIDKKRSLGVFLSTFCLMPLDTDGRMRCSFNVCGTETMRFSSSENAFGTGGNLQNIPKGDKE
jgi:DNA polymerase-1